MYVIKLLRRPHDGELPLTTWLTSEIPLRWGERHDAVRFVTKGAAWQAAGRIRINGAWSVEDA